MIFCFKYSKQIFVIKNHSIWDGHAAEKINHKTVDFWPLKHNQPSAHKLSRYLIFVNCDNCVAIVFAF